MKINWNIKNMNHKEVVQVKNYHQQLQEYIVHKWHLQELVLDLSNLEQNHNHMILLQKL